RSPPLLRPGRSNACPERDDRSWSRTSWASGASRRWQSHPALFALHKVNGNRGEPAGRLALGIIPFAGLHDVILLFGCEMKLMVAQFGIRVGRVAQAVLAAQFHFDLPVDLVNRLFLGELKEAPTGLAGD